MSVSFQIRIEIIMILINTDMKITKLRFWRREISLRFTHNRMPITDNWRFEKKSVSKSFTSRTICM